MEALTGPITARLDPALRDLWEERAPYNVRLRGRTWEQIIASVQDTARKAAALDGVTPLQVINGQIEAVRQGHIHGKYANAEFFYAHTAPFCGCLIGWAGHIAGQDVSPWHGDNPLFKVVRGRYIFAPVEILAFLLEPGEQNTPQAALVIRALEQAKEGL